MIPDPTNVEEDITPRLVEKLLQQSGLDHNVTAEKYDELAKSLRTQIGFINNLYSEHEHHGDKKENNSEVFRLLAADHHPSDPLTLLQLLEQVQRMETETAEEDTVDQTLFRSHVQLKK